MGFIVDLAKRLNPNGEYVSGKGTIYRQSWTPVVAANTGIHAAISCPASGTTTVTTGITNPDVPRVVRIKGNQASVTGNVVVVGTNQFGETKTDTIASSGVSAVDGVIAFRTITSITVPTQGAGGDTISLGPGTALGLDRRISTPAAVFSGDFNGVREATLPTVNSTNYTITFNSAGSFDGSKKAVAYYAHEDLRA